VAQTTSADQWQGRDLAIEATIIDIKEAIEDPAAPPAGRRALRALRRTVDELLPPRQQQQPQQPQLGDGLDELAEDLAELLEGAGARVAVRSPSQHDRSSAAAGGAAAAADAAAAAALPPAARVGRGVGKQSFVLRGRFIVVKGDSSGDAEGELPRACGARCSGNHQ
jgi:hypothetical protein